MSLPVSGSGVNGGSYGHNGCFTQNGARSGAAPANGEQLLQQAMQADARVAARRTAKAPFAELGVKFVEVCTSWNAWDQGLF